MKHINFQMLHLFAHQVAQIKGKLFMFFMSHKPFELHLMVRYGTIIASKFSNVPITIRI